jgi:hypothetical protein
VFGEMRLRWRRWDTALPAARFHGAWPTDLYTIASRGSRWVAGLEGMRTKGLRPSRRGRRRSGRGNTGAVAALCRGACALSRRGRTNVRARACAWARTPARCATRAQVWRQPKRGGAAECTAEPGPTPWAAVDKATAFGCKHTSKKTATKNTVFLPLGDRAPVPQGHGGSRRRGRLRHDGVGSKKGPKARPCLQGYGARVLGCTLARERRGPHGHARGHARDEDVTRARRHGAAATKRGGVLRLEGRS